MDQLSPGPAEATPQRYLVVGLGNPGREHQFNRHNLGFMTVDRLAHRHDIPLSRVQQRAIVGQGTVAGHPVILAKPQTYMNASGESVGALVRYYKVPLTNVMVVYDELDIPFGSLRLREKGGPGGHNGMRSIIQHLGESYPRLRLGIGRPPGRMPPAAYVLHDFSKDELPVVDEVLTSAVEAVETYIRDGIDLAMSRHNGPLANVDAS